MATTYNLMTSPRWVGTVAAGDTKVLLIPPHFYGSQPSDHPVTVSATPGAGGTVLAQSNASAHATIQAGGGTWHDWRHGVSDVAEQDLLYGNHGGIALTAAVADGAFVVSM